MKKDRRSTGWPHPAARGAAWVMTFLLSLGLTMSIMGTAFFRGLTSEGLHAGLAEDSEIIRSEMETIARNVEELAQDYGFSRETVMSAVDEAEYAVLKKKAARWWEDLIIYGDMDPAPVWLSSSLGSLLEEDPQLREAYSGHELWAVSEEIANAVEQIVNRTLLPVRARLVLRGAEWIRVRADYPSLIHAARLLPGLGFACCALAAGLIMLLLAGRPGVSLKFFGTAAGGAGLQILLLTGLIWLGGIRGMLAEASDTLLRLFDNLLKAISLQLGAVCVILLAVCWIFMRIYVRRVLPGREKPPIPQTAPAEEAGA